MSPGRVARILNVILALVRLASSADSRCQGGWKYLKKTESCYKLDGNGKKVSWKQARDSCISQGGDLISIHSEEEQKLAYELGKGAGVAPGFFGGNGIWIGLKRKDAKSEWKWSDCTPTDLEKWARGLRNTFEKEDCAELLTGFQGQWNDYDCSGERPGFGAVGWGLCKKPLNKKADSCKKDAPASDAPSLSNNVTEPEPLTNATESAFPNDATESASSSNSMASESPSTAKTTPKTTPKSKTKTTKTTTKTTTKATTTATTTKAKTTTVTTTKSKSATITTTAAPSNGTELEAPTNATEPKTASNNTKCDNGLMLRENFSYFWIGPDPPRDFWAAEKECKSCGGHLASIHSGDEATFINQNFVSKLQDRYIWSGLYDATNCTGNPRKWTHTDGTPYDATFWQHGQPDNDRGAEGCMVYENGKYGTWDDVPCFVPQKYSVCKKKAKLLF